MPRFFVPLLCLATLAAGEATSADWPAWRGPDGSGCAAPCGKPLVDDLVQMKQVWRSEFRDIPSNCWHGGRHGGYDSPIVADGLVILSYQRGSGDIVDATIQNKSFRDDPAKLKECQAVAADHHVICVDAATGRTKWDVVLDTGPNLYQRRKRPGVHHSPVYHEGKIYSQSSLGKVYRLSAEDGKVEWTADVPQTEHQLKVLAAYRQAAKQHPYRGVEPEELKGVGIPFSFMHPVVHADGVVVAHSGNLVAFDAATGKELWQAGGSGHCSPLRWVADGREYLVVGTRLIEPRTGKVLWQIKDAHCQFTPTVGDGHLVFGAGKAGIACYTITPQGFEKKWAVPDYGPGMVVGVIHDGWYYAQVKGPREQMPKGVVEYLVSHELATGKQGVQLDVVGVSQTLCTSLVATDDRLFGMAGAGYSGMWMAQMAGEKTDWVGLRMPTNKTGIVELPGGAGQRERLDYCLTSTPAIVDGRMYWRGVDSLYCYELKK